MQQHDDLVLRSQVDASNRAVHEHRVLRRSLHYRVVYDQLAVPNLACLKILIRRPMFIERAHSGGQGSVPINEGSEHFMGMREAADGSVVDLAAVRYTAERLHVESEALKQQRHLQQERRAWGLPATGPAIKAGASDDEDQGDGAQAGTGKGDRGSKDSRVRGGK